MCDDLISWFRYHPQLTERFEYFYFPTANISVRSEVFTSIGAFDENMRYGEDVALCLKAQHKGYKLYFKPKAKVYHINRISFKDIFKHINEWAIGSLLLTQRKLYPPREKGQITTIKYFGQICKKSKKLNVLFLFPFFCIMRLYFHIIVKTQIVKYLKKGII